MSATRRPPGTGQLWARTDSAGRDTWYAKFTVDGVRVKRAIGPKRSEHAKDGLTRQQAESELRKLMAKTKPRPWRGDRLTVSELGERYQRHLEARGRKRTTQLAAGIALRVHLVPFFADKPIDRIRDTDIEALIQLMLDKDLAPKTVRNYVGTLSAALNYAVKQRWLGHTPCQGVELPPKADDDEIHFLEPDEVRLLANHVVPSEFQTLDRAMYLTAAMTGLRQGELIALRWRDVDWRAGRIRVRQNYVRGEFGTPKSKRSTRSVPMADEVAGDLDRLSQAAGEQDPDALVFADPQTGEPLERAGVLRRFKRTLAAVGLDRSRVFHDLRHTFGTRMAAQGVPMRTLQEWMGHRDIATTQIYADYAPSIHEAAWIQAAFKATSEEAVSPVVADLIDVDS